MKMDEIFLDLNPEKARNVPTRSPQFEKRISAIALVLDVILSYNTP